MSPTNDSLKDPNRTSKAGGAFALIKVENVESNEIMSFDINVQNDTSETFIDNDNITNLRKCQIEF